MGYRPHSSAVSASRTCASCPNVNELLWYALKGDPHWDVSIWTTMGHLYAGGMWFKKKAYINGYNSAKAPDGIDYTTTLTSADQTNKPIANGKPVDITKYFYLPAQGLYVGGTFFSVGVIGTYWSKTPRPWENTTAYYLGITYDHVRVSGNDRNKGFMLLKGQ